MATCHRLDAAPRAVLLKGAPEALLRLCARRPSRVAAGAPRGRGDGRRARCACWPSAESTTTRCRRGFDPLRGRVRLLGLVGQIDPPREEVKAAVAGCRAAGIRPVMVTGDHKLTGLAIARELGIARDGDRAVDGPELERMGEAELRDALPPSRCSRACSRRRSCASSRRCSRAARWWR